MAESPIIFADGVLEANVRHGVARMTLAVQGGDGKPAASGMLVVPLTQLPALAGSLTRLLREVEAKAKEQATRAAPASEAPPAATENAPLPPAFRFQG
ncbi:hypothetical protein [Muricoccus radiodurans]|uniref:hypothetical protein n=1 Tax=Muricoccus radiodurans TaxID=2231721 RepID=UPI003CEA9595